MRLFPVLMDTNERQLLDRDLIKAEQRSTDRRRLALTQYTDVDGTGGNLINLLYFLMQCKCLVCLHMWSGDWSNAAENPALRHMNRWHFTIYSHRKQRFQIVIIVHIITDFATFLIKSMQSWWAEKTSQSKLLTIILSSQTLRLNGISGWIQCRRLQGRLRIRSESDSWIQSWYDSTDLHRHRGNPAAGLVLNLKQVTWERVYSKSFQGNLLMPNTHTHFFP